MDKKTSENIKKVYMEILVESSIKNLVDKGIIKKLTTNKQHNKEDVWHIISKSNSQSKYNLL